MPTLSFEGDTHDELVAKVKRWLASLEGEQRPLSPQEAIEAGAHLTKEALRVIASAAPAPVAQSEVVRAVTQMGYKATDATKQALVDSLDTLSHLTDGVIVRRVQEARKSAVYEMNAVIAKQLFRALRG